MTTRARVVRIARLAAPLAAALALRATPVPATAPTAAAAPAVARAPAATPFPAVAAAPAVAPVPAVAPLPAIAPTPAAPGTPAVAAARPPSPVSGIRGKISAADLPSAESILEVHRERHGEDGPWLNGLAWLARGALLLGETSKARRYADHARARCAERIDAGADLAKDADLETALGAAIEVRAQLLERERDAGAAVAYVREELDRLAGPVALRSRLHKRINLLSMVGTRAPELAVEDWIGARPPSLADLRGRPVLLFLWSESCGDCKAQSAALARARARHAARGLEVVALTRFYDEVPDHPAEKARADSVWRAVYADVGPVPSVVSTASMERYGGSSTPTFVFVDRAGVVREYLPYRLTEEALDRSIEAILRGSRPRAATPSRPRPPRATDPSRGRTPRALRRGAAGG